MGKAANGRMHRMGFGAKGDSREARRKSALGNNGWRSQWEEERIVALGVVALGDLTHRESTRSMLVNDDISIGH